MRLLTALVLGLCLAACSSSSTAPSSSPPCCGVTVPFISGQSFSVNPPAVLFSDQLVRTTSAPNAVTVTNTGNMPQPVRGRMNGELGREYAYTTDCPSMLAVGASCTLEVTFTPSATGFRGASLLVDGLNEEEGGVNLGGTGTN